MTEAPENCLPAVHHAKSKMPKNLSAVPPCSSHGHGLLTQEIRFFANVLFWDSGTEIGPHLLLQLV